MEFWINDTLLDQSWSLETLLCWMEILRYAYWQKLLTVVGWILCIFCFYCGHFESVQRRFTLVLLYSRFFFQKCLFKRQIFSKLVVSSKCWFRVFVWRSRQEAYSHNSRTYNQYFPSNSESKIITPGNGVVPALPPFSSSICLVDNDSLS